MNKSLTLALGAAAICLFSAESVLADEGMWTFDNFPAATVKAKYGVTISPAWLDKVRGAAVRLPSGCSASIVTADGLVLTNHHCARDCVQNLSTAKIDYVKNGFSAAARKNEKLCPGMQAEILTGISDVTQHVTAASAGKTGQDFVKARDGAIADIEKAGCAGREAKFRCEVVTLYQGGQYKLYTYRKYTDVRLVFAPEQQTAFFGGDPDNFNFPRYNLDISFLRLYENGRPAATPDHLRWSVAPPKEGMPVFTVGNPGSTQRLLTAEQLESMRDFALPEIIVQYSEIRGRLIRFGEESPERARISDDLLLSIENSFKAYRGREAALVDPAMIAAKRSADKELRAKVAANPSLSQTIGDPWADIAKVQADRRALFLPFSFMEARAGFRSQLFNYARDLVRAAEERAKPNSERLPEYTDSNLPLLKKQMLDRALVYPEVERLVLEFWLSKLRENLTADAPATRTFLGKDSPERLAARLATSKLADPALRKRLWDGGLKAVKASKDPMIRFVLATDKASRAIRKEYEDRVSGPTDRAAEKIAKARFAILGTGIYPDATFTPRLSYGSVAGWTENGKTIPPFTYFGGFWERATGQFPFNLAPRWLAAKGKVNAGTVFNFTTTNDIIGGNSGSPVITADGEVIGVLFDGNIQSLGGAFGYDERVNRAVAVSSAAITEALRNIYGQQTLVRELMKK